MCGRIPVVIDRRPAAITAAFLSLPPAVRGALWRGLWPFWLPRECAMLTACPDRAPIAEVFVADASESVRRRQVFMTYACQLQLRIGRPPKHDLETWTVTDDWPARVPVTDAEVDVFEAWFGDLLDELFGQCR
jgi:hypothetical protein